MFGVISSPTYIEDIERAIKNPPVFSKVGNFTEQSFFQHLQAASLISLSVLLIDVTGVPEEAIYKGIRLFRVQKPSVRVVIIYPGAEPGNQVISTLISTGIYDFVTPKIPEFNPDDEQQDEIVFDISQDIQYKLDNTGNYSDVIRWHVGSSLDFSFDLLTKNPVDEKNVTKTKTRLVTKETIKTEKVIEQQYISVPRNTIGIVNLSCKAGSSFITMNLAEAFNQHNVTVSVLDNPMNKDGKVFLFDYLGLGVNEDEEKTFYSIPHLIKKNSKLERNRVFSTKNIEWLITDSRNGGINDWNYEDMLKYLHMPKSMVTLLDMGRVSKVEDEAFLRIISELDLVLVILDAIPQELLANKEMFNFFSEKLNAGDNIKFVLNKWNEGIDERLLKEVGNLRDAVKVPYIEPSLVYRSIFNMLFKFQLPYGVEEIKNDLEAPLLEIMRMVIPSIKSEGTKIKSGLFGKFKKASKG